MTRYFTQKLNDGEYIIQELCGIAKYLGRLEDIEEELGIDLITLFKAQTKGFYYKTAFNRIEKALLSEWRFNLIKKEVHRIKYSSRYYFKDYGKTWALTKEELENDY